MIDIFVTSGKAVRKAKRAVTFSIDEMQGLKRDELKGLTTAMPRCNQLRLPVMVFGTGVPTLPRMLGNMAPYAERFYQFERLGGL